MDLWVSRWCKDINHGGSAPPTTGSHSRGKVRCIFFEQCGSTVISLVGPSCTNAEQLTSKRPPEATEGVQPSLTKERASSNVETTYTRSTTTPGGTHIVHKIKPGAKSMRSRFIWPGPLDQTCRSCSREHIRTVWFHHHEILFKIDEVNRVGA